jgi:outer membrane lipopolysaccharide assembly protein LptE/RlpB
MTISNSCQRSLCFRFLKSFLLTFFLFFFSNCGFQVKLDQYRLPDEAESICIDEISNRSYTPAADIFLRESLTYNLSKNGINTTIDANEADLVLYVTLSNNDTDDSSYPSYATYRVFDNRKQLSMRNKTRVELSSMESSDPYTEENELRSLMDSLAETIVSSLIQWF